MKRLFEPKPYGAILTIPNLITGSGIVLLFFYFFGFLYEYRWLMFTSLFFAGLSDLLDGFFAKRLNQQTSIGEFLDPLRDRLTRILILSHFLYLNGMYSLFSWCGIIVALELGIIILHKFLMPKQIKIHLVRKIRQAGHVILFGVVLLSLYFQDIIFKIFGFDLIFSFGMALPSMFIFSLLVFLFYLQLFLKKEN